MQRSIFNQLSRAHCFMKARYSFMSASSFHNGFRASANGRYRARRRFESAVEVPLQYADTGKQHMLTFHPSSWALRID